jgi:hypothetical protein
MKLAILIGASGKTKESPLVPLSAGKHKLIVTGVQDSTFLVMFDDGSCAQLGDTLEGGRTIKLVQQKEGTEQHTICIYAELVDGNVNNADA